MLKHLFLLILVFTAMAPGANLFDAVRKNDLAAIQMLSQEREALAGRGESGATPLIHAAAIGSADSVRALLEAGADVNAKTDLGATALVWAAGDSAKTRLLVEAGADVNAATKSGHTPLLVAAGRDGESATVELLLEHGADTQAADERGCTPLLAAAMAGDEATIRLLLERGADPNKADLGGNTALQSAAASGSRAMIRMLLDKGARVNDANTFFGAVRHGDIALKGLTPLMLAAPRGGPDILRMLIEAGAAVNARDSRGMTALMLAVASSRQDARAVKLLLERGADASIVSAAGETALDWASKFNDRRMMATLEKAGARRNSPVRPPPSAKAADRSTREAVESALQAIQRAETEFFRESACVSCHHQNMTQVATAVARRSEVSFDERAAADSVQATVAMWGAFAPALLERMDAPGTPDTPTFSLFALAMQGQAPSFVTDALFANIAAQQRRDGSWSLGGFARAPMEESDFARTAMAVYALTAYAPPGRRKEMDHRRTRARIWLEMHKPRTTEDRVWRLAGLKWAGAMPKYIRQAGRQLELMQHSDGGWSPSKAMASDAYATATALWALSEAGNVELNGPAYRRGARYLLSTQQADGTWLVRSRAPKFQPYFESGFPYGGDQWVSAAATAWAAAALAPAAGPRTATD